MTLNEEVKERLLQTITTMRDACDNAERAVREMETGTKPRTPLEAVAKVQASLSWGMANAWSSTESALLRVQHQAERDSYERGLAKLNSL
jgi:hypothetical protein